MDNKQPLLAGERWKQLPLRATGDGHHNDIYMAVGHALSVWEWLEEQLGHIFSVLVESKSGVASQVYGVISANKTKAQMLEVAFTVFAKRHKLPKENCDRFKGLLNHYGRAVDYRNHIAHGTVVHFEGGAFDFTGCFLVPPVYNTKRYLIPDDKLALEMAPLFGSAQYRYTAADIGMLAAKFQLLSRQARQLREDLGKVRTG